MPTKPKSLKARLQELPSLKITPGQLSADHFNRVRLALLRIANPLRLELPGLRSLEMILEDELWAIIDRDLNDLPVVAWTDFASRSGLHEAVACTMRYYHAHADVVIPQALSLLDGLLDEQLGHGHHDPKP